MSTLSTKYKTIIVLSIAILAIFAATASAAVILHHQDANRTTENTLPATNPPVTKQLHQTDQSEQYRSEPASPQPSGRDREHPPTPTNQAGLEAPHDSFPNMGPPKFPTEKPIRSPRGEKAFNDTPANTGPPEPPEREPSRSPKAEEELETASTKDKDQTNTKHRSQPQRRELQASNTDDNEKWQEYLTYRNGHHPYRTHPFPVNNRTTLTLAQQDNLPVHDAPVTISVDGQQIFHGRTYADGTLMFFPKERPEDGFDVEVATTPPHLFKSLELPEDMQNIFVLGNQPGRPEKQPLDVLFLIDSTGSMADEIHRIKATLLSIAESISTLPSQPDLRFAMVAYRDRGDDYVTRTFAFESDPEEFLRTIQHLQAQADGDYPESLNEALHAAVNDVKWRETNTVRLMFLIADAPPHLDYQQDHSYAKDMVTAREKGIKVHAVATSGLDPQGEYIFRQIAQNTRGRFVFLLYPTGKQGQLTTPHQVGNNYQPEHLDNLIVRLVTQELAYLNPQDTPARTPSNE